MIILNYNRYTLAVQHLLNDRRIVSQSLRCPFSSNSVRCLNIFSTFDVAYRMRILNVWKNTHLF